MSRLKEVRTRLNMGQKEVAIALGVKQPTVSAWENGHKDPTVENLAALADLYSTTVDYLLGRTDDPTDYENGDLIASLPGDLVAHFDGDIRKALAAQKAKEQDASAEQDTPNLMRKGTKIPVLGRVAAGVPLEAVEEILDYEEITPEMASAGDYFALMIQGNSMEPKMSEGDVVVVRRQSDVDSGNVAVVLVNGGDATVKRVLKRENGIVLQPTNPSHEPLFFTFDEIKALPVVVIGRVVELRAKF